MPELAQTLTLAALVIALLLAGGQRWRRRRRFARGAAAEVEAVELAKRHGYRVLATQVAGTATIIVDGERLESPLRADLLLSKWGRRYLGEVKSGRRAPDPKDRSTRRQLLEYSLAFDVHGLLLFDMSARVIRRVEFERRVGRRSGLGLLFGILLGLALGALVVRFDLLAALREVWP